MDSEQYSDTRLPQRIRDPETGIFCVNQLPALEKEVALAARPIPDDLKVDIIPAYRARRAWNEPTWVCNPGLGCDSCSERQVECRAKLPRLSDCALCMVKRRPKCNLLKKAGYGAPEGKTSYKPSKERAGYKSGIEEAGYVANKQPSHPAR